MQDYFSNSEAFTSELVLNKYFLLVIVDQEEMTKTANLQKISKLK